MVKQTVFFEFQTYAHASELSESDQRLLQQAREAAQKAYAPYSQFPVGAAARLINGRVITGANLENASYPVGICAERVLLGHHAMVAENQPIDTMAVSTPAYPGPDPASPCGMCRQALFEAEFRQTQPIRILLQCASDVVWEIYTVKNLLPLPFRFHP